VNVLVVLLVLALVASLVYIKKLGGFSARKPIVDTHIELNDSELLTEAIGRLNEEEFAAFKADDERIAQIVAQKIDEIKAARIPDYEFLKQQYEQSLKGARIARKEYIDLLGKGLTHGANGRLEASEKLQASANEFLVKLNRF
jgi:hypothetical protein